MVAFLAECDYEAPAARLHVRPGPCCIWHEQLVGANRGRSDCLSSFYRGLLALRQERKEAPVGKLTYDASLVVDFDDRTLAHLQIVITAKLRRGESFAFSWRDDAAIGDGRTAVWMHPTISLVFKFLGGRPPEINKQWADELATSSNSPAGLRVTPEPH